MHFSNDLTIVYRTNCWYCDDFYVGKTKRRRQDWKTAYFKALAKQEHISRIADHIKATGHNIKWDHSGKTDYLFKIKETFFIH